jgi:hypothetical protein
VARAFSLGASSEWAALYKPGSFYGTGRNVNRTVGAEAFGPANAASEAEEVLAYVEAGVASVDAGYPVADAARVPGEPSCAVGGADCGFLIDHMTHVSCPRRDAGAWAGTCVKPAAQLVTPARFAEEGLVAAAFNTTDANRFAECPAYEPELQIIAPVAHKAFSHEVLADGGRREQFANRVAHQAVHYCDRARSHLVYCDNDALPHADRAALCAAGGGLVYSGVRLDRYDFATACRPADKTCYLLPGVPGFGTLRAVYGAIAGQPDPEDWTIVVLPFTYDAVASLLLGAVVYDVRRSNTADPAVRCGGGCGAGADFCERAELEKLNATVILEQGLLGGGLSLARGLCGGRVDDAAVIAAMAGLAARPNYTDVRRGVVRASPRFYEARVEDTGTLTVTTAGLTIRPLSGRLNLTALSFRVLAEGFALRDADLGTAASPAVGFYGASVENARLVNVHAVRSVMAAGFLGGTSDFAPYAPAISVDGVVLANVTGHYTAGFARAVGDATVSLAMATLTPPTAGCNVWASAYGVAERGADDTAWTVVGTQALGRSATWHGAFAVAGDVQHHGHLVNARTGQCVHVAGDRFVLGLCPGPRFTVGMHLEGDPFFCTVHTPAGFRYVPCSPCMVGTGRHAAVCPADALPTPHSGGLGCDRTAANAPVVLAAADGVAGVARLHRDRRVVVHGAAAAATAATIRALGHTAVTAVGTAEEAARAAAEPVQCTACGLAAAPCTTARPTGAQILACAAGPHGAVAAYSGPPCTGMLVVEQPGAAGAIYDCGAEAVVVGGYGYTTAGDVVTHQILLQPEGHLDGVRLHDQATEVINITAYTSIFGRAYEVAIYHTGPSTAPLTRLVELLLLLLLLLEVTVHVALTYGAP